MDLAKYTVWGGLFVLAILFVMCETANAITLKTAPEILEKLEKDYKEIQKELSALEKELPGIIKEGTTLKERGDYIRTILKLRKKLKKIKERRESLIGKVKRLPHAPPILKLVEIEANLGGDYQVSGGWLGCEGTGRRFCYG